MCKIWSLSNPKDKQNIFIVIFIIIVIIAKDFIKSLCEKVNNFSSCWLNADWLHSMVLGWTMRLWCWRCCRCRFAIQTKSIIYVVWNLFGACCENQLLACASDDLHIKRCNRSSVFKTIIVFVFLLVWYKTTTRWCCG